jgi:hypothetical protein
MLKSRLSRGATAGDIGADFGDANGNPGEDFSGMSSLWNKKKSSSAAKTLEYLTKENKRKMLHKNRSVSSEKNLSSEGHL